MNRIALFTAVLTATTLGWTCSATAQGSTARAAAADTQEPQAAEQEEDGWVEFLPGGIRARMLMPVEPKHRQRRMSRTEDIEITLDTYLGTVANGKRTFVFSHFVLADVPVGEKATAKRYDEAVMGQINRVAAEVDSYQRVELQGSEGRDLVYRFSNDKGVKFKTHVRLFIRSNSMFEVKVVALEDSFSEEDAAKFFQNFRFSKANPMPVEEPAEEPSS